MKKRISEVNGTFDISSVHGTGTSVKFSLPVIGINDVFESAVNDSK